MAPDGPAGPPPAARVELLIRGSGGPDGSGGFDIISPDPGQAFLRMRPQRRSSVTLEENPIDEADGTIWVVRLNMGDTERYLRLSERERYLFVHMDGMHTVQDLALAMVLRYHSLDLDEVGRFIKKAHRMGIIDVKRPGLLRYRDPEREAPRSVTGRLYRRLLSLERRWTGVDRAFKRAGRWVGWLLDGRMVAALAPVAVLGLWLWLGLRWGGRPGPALPLWAQGAVVAVGLVVASLPHELAHGVACVRHGRRVKGVGISFLDGIVPAFYVDVSDMLMAGRWARISVALAGPWTNLLLAGLSGLMAALLPGILSDVLLLLADANVLLALYTLWPFHGLEEDGYHALVDLTRVSAIRERSSAMVRSWFGRAPRPEMSARSLRVVRLYLLLRLASWGLGGVVVGLLAQRLL
jgi:putative peptide zinc metalloprotease protein